MNNLTEDLFIKNREDKEHYFNQHAKVFWFTGLSGSGKSTLANRVDECLIRDGYFGFRLDGDNIRIGLNKDLDFSVSGRDENIRRVAELCKILVTQGITVLATFVSPFEHQREMVRSILGKDVVMVYVKANLEDCIKRDPKKLYEKAQRNEVNNFTGIAQGFDEPMKADFIIDTSQYDLEESVDRIYAFVLENIKVC